MNIFSNGRLGFLFIFILTLCFLIWNQFLIQKSDFPIETKPHYQHNRPVS